MSRRYSPDKKKSNKDLLKKRLGIGAGVVVAAYFGMAIIFAGRYYPGTTIEGSKCGFKSVKQVQEMLADSVKGYSIQVEGNDYRQETITADQVKLEFYDDGKLAEIKSNQPALTWIYNVFQDQSYSGYSVSLNDKALDKAIASLKMSDKKKWIDAKSAEVKYDKGTDLMTVMAEREGSALDKKAFKKGLKKAILERQEIYKAGEQKGYKEAKVKWDSKVLAQNAQKMNKYCKAEIIYDFDDRAEIVDGSVISKWVYIDDNQKARIDEEAVAQYVYDLCEEYDTVGKTREFQSLSGNWIEVSGGTYGWKIDEEEEFNVLYSQVANGEQVKRTPEYSHIAKSRKVNDVGDTYVEVDLASQYVWCFVNGEEITEGPCVTGATALGRDTPSGSFYVLGKDTNTYLTGANYRSFVNFWMPFTDDGVGLHNAPWRGDFGGSIYVYSGSHGCVNLPYSLAQEIYENFEETYPVIVHW